MSRDQRTPRDHGHASNGDDAPVGFVGYHDDHEDAHSGTYETWTFNFFRSAPKWVLVKLNMVDSASFA